MGQREEVAQRQLQVTKSAKGQALGASVESEKMLNKSEHREATPDTSSAWAWYARRPNHLVIQLRINKKTLPLAGWYSSEG